MDSKMNGAAYAEMRGRLAEFLQRYGIWTESELEEMARFVEREMVEYAAKLGTPLPDQPTAKISKHHVHVWRPASRQQQIIWCCLKSKNCVARVLVTCECGSGYCAAHAPKRARQVLPPYMKGSRR